MKTSTTIVNVTVGEKQLSLSFHVVIPNYQINTETKTIIGMIQSFNDNTIIGNIINGTVRPSKISQFTILNADLTNMDSTVSTYIDSNISNILQGNNAPVQAKQ